jgi:hypothetical protein
MLACEGTATTKRQTGTDAGYNRHRRRREPPCDECRSAHSAAVTKWRNDMTDSQRVMYRKQRKRSDVKYKLKLMERERVVNDPK